MKFFVYFFTIVFFTSFDQITKYLIENNLYFGEKIIIINNFFNITKVRNFGAGFSILQNARLFLLIISILAIIFIIYLLTTTKQNHILRIISYLLIISGALGNMIDRLRFGYVTDFLDFKIFGYDFPVFNIADICITIGGFLYIFDSFFGEKDAYN